MADFQSMLDAIDKYAEQTGVNLIENPFAEKVKDCNSPSDVLLLVQENLKAFKGYWDRNRKFIDCISPVVQFVHAFSGILCEASRLVSYNHFPIDSFLLFLHKIPFQPAKIIFVGINVLFTERAVLLLLSPFDIRMTLGR